MNLASVTTSSSFESRKDFKMKQEVVQLLTDLYHSRCAQERQSILSQLLELRKKLGDRGSDLRWPTDL